MHLESLAEDARRRARKEYFGTSTARHQRDLGKIASPLRLQMREDLSMTYANSVIMQVNYILQAF